MPTTHDRGLLSPVEPAGSNDPAVRIVKFSLAAILKPVPRGSWSLSN